MWRLVDLNGSGKPYVPQLRVQVVGFDATDQRRFAIADATSAVSCTVFNEKHIDKMKEGASLLILNSAVKRYPNKDAHVEVGFHTRVSKTSKVDVPEEIRKRGKELMEVIAADFVEIASVRTSPVHKMVSLRGKVLSEEMPKTVQAKGRDVKVRNIVLKDKGATCRVALWRDQATSGAAAIGEFVEVTNVVVNEFEEVKYVSSTRCSGIKKVEEQIMVIGFEVKEEFVQLTTEEEGFPTYNIAKEQVMECFEVGEEYNIDELLTRNIPFKCKIVPNDKGENCFSLFL